LFIEGDWLLLFGRPRREDLHTASPAPVSRRALGRRGRWVRSRSLRIQLVSKDFKPKNGNKVPFSLGWAAAETKRGEGHPAMEFEKGTPKNTLAFSPTRQISFIIDPRCVFSLDGIYADALRLVDDLKLHDPAVSIHLLLPSNLADEVARTVGARVEIGNRTVKQTKQISLDPVIPSEFRDALLASDDEAKLAMNLLSVSHALQADGIVTAAGLLTQARYHLYNKHLIRIVPLEDLPDVVEIFAHGHSIFWSCSNPNRRLTADVFYPWAHLKCSRYYNWFEKVRPNLNNEDLEVNLRSVLINRYTFLLYSRTCFDFISCKRTIIRGVGFCSGLV
jgi:hypothetical protein